MRTLSTTVGQDDIVLTLPGLPTVMTPPHVHWQVHVDVRAGMLPI
jgi:hypothetical protein